MAQVASKDARTTTAGNLVFLAGLTGLDCTEADRTQVKALLPVEVVPETESWRLGLLDGLLNERCRIVKEGGDTRQVVAMISSLCTS